MSGDAKSYQSFPVEITFPNTTGILTNTIDTVPSNRIRRYRSIFFRTTTDATVANRRFTLDLRTSNNSAIWRIDPYPVAILASTVHNFSFMYQFGDHIDGAGNALVDFYHSHSLVNMWAMPGWQLQVRFATGWQASGDVLSATRIEAQDINFGGDIDPLTLAARVGYPTY